jgi:RNase P subunit RPR2
MRANHRKNKEKYNARRMSYYHNHIEEAKEYAKKYGREHREEMNARRRKHRAENIEQVNAKIKWMTCPVCKSELQTGNWKRHTLTTIHQENSKKLEN